MKILEYIATATAAASFGGVLLTQLQVSIAPILQLIDRIMA